MGLNMTDTMLDLHQKTMRRDQAYEARAIVARLGVAGKIQRGIVHEQISKFLTLYQGEGKQAIPVEFSGLAPYERDAKGDLYLNLAAVEEGMFVINPGLLYRKCLWFDALMAAHMRAIVRFKPKEITVAEKADAPTIDLPTIDTTYDQVTKQ